MKSGWMDVVKESFPEALITEKLESPIEGFKLFEVSMGDGTNAYFYSHVS